MGCGCARRSVGRTTLTYARRRGQGVTTILLEEFKNKQPKAFQCKLFDLINTLNSNSNKRHNRGKWERAHAIALLEEIASYKKV